MERHQIIEVGDWFRATLASDCMGPEWNKGDSVDFAAIAPAEAKTGRVYYVADKSGAAWFLRLAKRKADTLVFESDDDSGRTLTIHSHNIARMARPLGVYVPVEQIAENGSIRRAEKQKGRNRPIDAGMLGGHLLKGNWVPAFAC